MTGVYPIRSRRSRIDGEGDLIAGDLADGPRRSAAPEPSPDDLRESRRWRRFHERFYRRPRIGYAPETTTRRHP
jgi:hypothetical protein